MADFPKDECRRRVLSAFSGATCPPPEHSIDPECGSVGEWIVEWIAEKKPEDWTKLPPEDLGSLWFSMGLRDMSPEAFAFFIPGYMLLALDREEKDDGWVFSDAAVDAFAPPETASDRGNASTTFTRRIERLTEAQLDAALFFFNWVDERSGYDTPERLHRILADLVRRRGPAITPEEETG